MGFRTFHFLSFLYVFFFSFLFLLFRFFSHYFVSVFCVSFFFVSFRCFSPCFLFIFFSFRFFSFFSVSQFTGTRCILWNKLIKSNLPESIFEYCTLSKPPQRRQGPDPPSPLIVSRDSFSLWT